MDCNLPVFRKESLSVSSADVLVGASVSIFDRFRVPVRPVLFSLQRACSQVFILRLCDSHHRLETLRNPTVLSRCARSVLALETLKGSCLLVSTAGGRSF